MSENRESIVLRGEDLEEFRDLKKRLINQGYESNVAIFRKLLNFYKANSPFLRQKGKGSR